MHRYGSRSSGPALWVFLLNLLLTCAPAPADSYAGRTAILQITGLPADLRQRDSHIDYNIDLKQEHFFMKVPAQYTDSTPYGLLIFLPAGDNVQQVPPEWNAVLDQHKLIFLAPEQAGKNVAISRRLGLAVLAALWSKGNWNIDSRRVYVTGDGEAARVAGLLGFYAPSVFSGSIQVCGADFFGPLPPSAAKPVAGDAKPYGTLLSDATPAEIAAAKSFRFVFLTGKDDPHHAEIATIAQDGYAKNGFHSELIDGLGINPEQCTPRRLNQAIDFLDGIKTTVPAEPVPPPWMAKDPSQWPRILLSNRVVDAGGGVGEAGSSSFGRVPNGAVVLLTARHLLGGESLANFSKVFKTWTAYSVSPNSGVRITRVAMEANEPASFDALVLCPASQDEHWPAAVLPVRQEPLEIGETVYLVAVPHNQSRARQQVFKGTIVSEYQDKQLQYNVDGEFDTMGCSGAPIIDEYGRLAAINLGHLNSQSIPGKRELTCIATSEVLPAIRLPADVHPVPEQSNAGAVPKISAQDSVSQKADAALRRAQLLLDNKVYAKAREQLQGIIDAYPKTDAARKARVMLTQIPTE